MIVDGHVPDSDVVEVSRQDVLVRAAVGVTEVENSRHVCGDKPEVGQSHMTHIDQHPVGTVNGSVGEASGCDVSTPSHTQQQC